MSAICGILNLNGEPVESAMLQQMVDSSPYRGDDGIGYWREGPIGLAHRAFHVTPESVREKQPLKSSDGKLVLVADVRLDNRDELMRALADAPDDPTDPDLLLAAYRRWGNTCVEHLLGDFAFAVWNSDKRELFLARDPMGAYGFFWHQSGKRFLFASELTALLDNREVRPGINETAVTKYLIGRSLDHEETFFQEFYACPAAHCMTVSGESVRIWRYWDIDPEYRIHYQNEHEYTDHFLEILDQAVACRMRSIGMVGISLSGGCDSTLIAAVASRLLPEMKLPQQRLKSFSYVFNEFTQCDERQWIQPVVDQYKIDATFIPSDKKTAFSDINLIPFYREFFSYDCLSQLPLSIMEAAGKNSCRVLLDGHYGDTLFADRSYYIADAIRERKWPDLLDWVRRYRTALDLRRDIVNRGLRPLLPRPLRQVYRKFHPQPLNVFNPGVAAERIHQLRKTLRESDVNSIFDALSLDGQQRYRRLFNSDSPHGYAISRGKFANRFGIERTSPYFDRRLTEFVLAVPPEQVYRPDEPRFLQRNAMRGLLPDEVSQRQKKTSFEPLLANGMEEYLQPFARELGDDLLIKTQGWVRWEWFQQQRMLKQAVKSGFPLSIFVNLELWLRSVEKTHENRNTTYIANAQLHRDTQ